MRIQSGPPPLPKPQVPKENPKPQGDGPAPDPFEEVSVNKNRVAFEVAYNVGNAVGAIVEGAAKTSQYAQLVGSALGFQTGSLAGMGALVGGTYDVARGASITQQSAFNRNRTGCVMGGLQVAQGLATWTSALAPAFGAPPLVGRIASFAALGLVAGQVGYKKYAEVSAKPHKDDSGPGGGNVSMRAMAATDALLKQTNDFGSGLAPVNGFAAIKESMDPPPEGSEAPKGKSRFFENSLAGAMAVNSWASNLGGVGSFWNNIDSIRGNKPGALWGPLGVIGSTYSVAMGVAEVRRAAVNHHSTDTVTGVLDIAGGVASLGASLGVGGRLAGGVALGAWVAKTGYGMWAQSKALRGEKEEGQSLEGRMWDNVKHVFSDDSPKKP